MKRQIQKVTILKNNKGVAVKYRGERDKKKTPHEVNEKIKAEPEGEFNQALKRMSGYLTKCSALGHAEHALEQDKLAEMITTADKPGVIKSVLGYVSKAVRITCVEFAWTKDDELSSVRILSEFTNHINETMPLEGPVIMVNERNYGFEGALLKDAQKLLDAVNGYLKGAYTQIIDDEMPEDLPGQLATADPGDKQEEEEEQEEKTMTVVDRKTTRAKAA